MATEPSPTTSVRPRLPLSVTCFPLARTSPAIVSTWSRTGLAVTTSTSPETELISWVDPDASSPSIRTSPLVVPASIASSRGARTRRSPETVRAPSVIDPVASRTTSPDMVSSCTRPASTASRMSPEAEAHRLSPAMPVASTSPLIVRRAIDAPRGRSMSRSGERRVETWNGPTL